LWQDNHSHVAIGLTKMGELETALRALFDEFGLDAVIETVSEIADELDPLPDKLLSYLPDYNRVMH
jgi:hypothetical protein